MKTYADLELSLHRRSDDNYTIEGRFTSTGDAAEISLGSKEPVTIPLDLMRLQDCLPDMNAYGKILTEAFFVPEVKKLFLYAQAVVESQALRVRLLIGPSAPELHGLHWETLQHPDDTTLLSANQNILFSRYLTGENWTTVELTQRAKIRAVVAVAGPKNLPDYKLTPIDTAREVEQVRASLKNIETVFLPANGQPCSLPALVNELRQGCDILYLVAHGSLVNGIPYLWLEDENEQVKRITGKDFAEQISNLDIQPRLVVLASCESAGKASEDQNDTQALQALGPLLAAAGVPAVIAMQGKISQASIARLMPVFFDELLEDGLVDRALASARSLLQTEDAHDLWMPVLFSRLNTGALWREELEEQLQQVHKSSRASLKLQWFWFPLLFLTILGVGLALYFGLRPQKPAQMTGDFRIAVVSFAVSGKNAPKELGYDLAESIRLRLEQDLQEINPELVITVWGPDLAGEITGANAAARAEAAEALAQKIHADLVLYGAVETSGARWQILPEFYLAAENFYEAREIIGQHELGTPLELSGSATNSAWRFEFGKQMFSRSKALSAMSVGLGYFALRQYPTALASFQNGLTTSDWNDAQGKKVLYLMAGNAAAKTGETYLNQKDFKNAENSFSISQEMLNKAIEIDPQYARPYISLANLAYARALIPALTSNSYSAADPALLQQCLETLSQAESAQNKPPLADTTEKIHFSRGQCLFLQALAGLSTSFAPALQEFQQVIQAYDTSQNQRLREISAESHARLAAIYLLKNNLPQALKEYQTAADLLAAYPERQQMYQERAANLLTTLTPQP
jgi:tetratricopeptide (TPR) repeat protein